MDPENAENPNSPETPVVTAVWNEIRESANNAPETPIAAFYNAFINCSELNVARELLKGINVADNLVESCLIQMTLERNAASIIKGLVALFPPEDTTT